MRRNGILLTILVVLMLGATHLWAQPDSSGKNQFDFVVTINGTKEVVTVIRDALDANQWFYIPSRPRVVIRDKEPVFALVKYQAQDPTNRSKLLQGGIVQFSVTMSLPPEAIDQIEAKIASKLPAGSPPVKLTALPFNDCKVELLTPKGEFLAETSEAKSITTTFGSSEVPFQIQLTTLGADVYQDLCEGNTGLPVIVTYKYPAVTPETQATAEINFEQAFEHISKDLSAQAQVGYAGSGISGGYDATKIRELMKGDKGIKVNIFLADEKDQEFIDKCYQPVLEKLYTELFEGPKFPDDFKTDPAVAKPPEILPTQAEAIAKAADAALSGGSGGGDETASGTASGTSGTGTGKGSGVGGILTGLGTLVSTGALKAQVRIGYAMKDVKKVRKGTTKLDFRKRMLVEKTGGCGSFIGVGSFIKANPALKKKLIRDVSNSGWENAEFIMPKVEGIADLGVESIAMTVSVVGKGLKQIEPEGKAQALIFDPNKEDLAWSKDGVTQTKLNFPLKTMFSKYGKDTVSKEFQYKVEANIQVKLPTGSKKNYVLTQYQPLITGDVAMSTPLQFLGTLQFDATAIDWDAAKLFGININLSAKYLRAGKTETQPLSGSITKVKKDLPLTFQVPVGDDGQLAVVTGTVNYALKGKTIKGSVSNQPNIAEAGPTVFLMQEWDDDGNPIQ